MSARGLIPSSRVPSRGGGMPSMGKKMTSLIPMASARGKRSGSRNGIRKMSARGSGMVVKSTRKMSARLGIKKSARNQQGTGRLTHRSKRKLRKQQAISALGAFNDFSIEESAPMTDEEKMEHILSKRPEDREQDEVEFVAEQTKNVTLFQVRSQILLTQNYY